MPLYQYLNCYPQIFLVLTGLKVEDFDAMLEVVWPHYVQAEIIRLSRPNRQRSIGGGSPFKLAVCDQILLTLIWLRKHPTYAALGHLFGISEVTAGRYIKRLVPLLEAVGHDRARLTDPGRKRRPQVEDLLEDVPGLSEIVTGVFNCPVNSSKQQGKGSDNGVARDG